MKPPLKKLYLIILLVLITCASLIFFAIATTPAVPLPQKQSQIPSSDSIIKDSPTIFSPDDKNWIRLHKSYQSIELQCSPLLTLLGKTNTPFVCFKKSFPKDSLFETYSPTQSDIAWSPNGKVLAIALPNSLEIFFLENYLDQTVERVKETRRLEFNLPYEQGQEIFFSGDNSELYVSKPNPIKIDLTPQDPLLESLGLSTFPSHKLYPVPNSEGFVHWIDNPYPKEQEIEIVTSANNKRFPVWRVDSPSKIFLSPNSKKVCLEGGSSGYYGYNIFDLTLGKSLKGGPQYSQCVRWLDNFRLVVSEEVYDFSVGSPHYYLFNTQTQSMELLSISTLDKKFSR